MALTAQISSPPKISEQVSTHSLYLSQREAGLDLQTESVYRKTHIGYPYCKYNNCFAEFQSCHLRSRRVAGICIKQNWEWKENLLILVKKQNVFLHTTLPLILTYVSLRYSKSQQMWLCRAFIQTVNLLQKLSSSRLGRLQPIKVLLLRCCLGCKELHWLTVWKTEHNH